MIGRKHNADPCPCGSTVARHLGGNEYQCKAVGCGKVFTRSRRRGKRLSAKKRTKAERDLIHAENYGALGEVVRGIRCIVAGCACRHVQLAHVKSRGAGHGAWRVLANGSLAGNLVPLCERHHREQHTRGIETFEQRVNAEGGFYIATVTHEWHPETLEEAAAALGRYARTRGVDPRTNTMRRTA